MLKIDYKKRKTAGRSNNVYLLSIQLSFKSQLMYDLLVTSSLYMRKQIHKLISVSECGKNL